MSEKFIVCIPRGCGFNDVLCQISEAYTFALKTNRKLIIDTRLSGLADDFSNYVISKDPSIEIELSNSRLTQLNSLSCYPNEIEGKIDLLYHKFLAVESKKASVWRYFNTVNNFSKFITYLIRPTFHYLKFNRIAFFFDYIRIRKNTLRIELDDHLNNSVDVLIYFRSGGGLDSLKSIDLFKLRPEISHEVENRLKHLAEDYDAIHIRHTDYKTDFKSFLFNIRDELKGRKVLLCTDNKSIIKYTTRILEESIIIDDSTHNTNELSSTKAKPLHFQWNLPLIVRRDNNIKMLSDLVGLARSSRLFFPKIIKWGNNPHSGTSGFSTLAEGLHNDQALLDRWLGKSSN